MIKLRQHERLVRLRTIERRMAVASVSEATAQRDRTSAQIARLEHLSAEISPGIGRLLGGSLAAAEEYVVRLANGYLTAERRLYRQSIDAEAAQQRYAVTDIRLELAARMLMMARQRAAQDNDLRRAREMPARPRPGPSTST